MMRWLEPLRRGFGPRRLRNGLDRSARRVLPRSLLARSLLIVLIPLLVTQAIALELFYGNYMSVVSRRLSDSVTGELMFTIELLDHYHGRGDREWVISRIRQQMQLAVVWHPNDVLPKVGSSHVLGPMDDDLSNALDTGVGHPYYVDWMSDPHTVHIFVQLRGGVLEVGAPRKRLDVGPIWLFIVWAVGSSLILFMIAGLFMRNQVRAIRRLARAAELFGMGRDTGEIRPEGAQEVRKAAVAFNRMQARILRFVDQRTSMLAGVSHDLRTPLTRLRLSLAMLPSAGKVEASELTSDVTDMVADIEEMERMISGYLAFARGEGAEAAINVDVGQLIQDVALAARRAGSNVVAVNVPVALDMLMRPGAMRRVLGNLAENARRHASSVAFAAWKDGGRVHIVVDDDGPGITPERRQDAFRAFERGEDGNTGLGLTIARDIVHAHGGEIFLQTSSLGGLRVQIILPL